jgi:phage/plasmid-associated DNA primase
MLHPDNLKRVLKWLVDGAVMWHNDGLKTPNFITQVTANQKLYNDSIGSFLQDGGYVIGGHLTEHYLYSVESLTDEYVLWCEQNRVTPVRGRRFSNYLKNKGALVGRDSPPIYENGAVKRVYRGIYKKQLTQLTQ